MSLFKKIKNKIGYTIKVWRRNRQIQKEYSFFDKDIISALLCNPGWAACPSLLSKLVEILATAKSQLIVEIGSGVTTILISKFKNKESKLFSLDQSRREINRTQSLVKNNSEIVFIPPIKDGFIDYSPLQKINTRVDLLIIDGPTGERFSIEAKKVYDQLVSKNTTCIIDDTDREENNRYASELATAKNLNKKDYTDPIYTNQKFSILFPNH